MLRALGFRALGLSRVILGTFTIREVGFSMLGEGD